MFTIWTKHLKDDEQISQFENTVHSSKTVLDRLKTLIEEDEKAQMASELDPTGFNTPNWTEKQASRIGYRACLAKYKKLVDLDQQKVPSTKE
jgi:hypothetical protein